VVKRRDPLVSTIRDGKTVRVDYYNDESQALEAAGVTELLNPVALLD
jgi:hypothetical protein